MWGILTSFDPSVLTAFIVAGLLLNLTPGADFVFVSASGIAGGPRVGMAAGVGINIGVTFHILAAAAGVSGLLLAYPGAYDAIRYIGAAYLLYLAWQSWRSSNQLGQGLPAGTAKNAIWRGFVTNVLNPKVALFVLAFIPQFTDPINGPIWAQILILGFIFQFNGLIFTLILGAAAGYFANTLRARVGILNKVSAILFGGLAARLVID